MYVDIAKGATRTVGATEEQRCSAQGRNAVARHKGEGRADLFLAYCTSGNTAAAELSGLQVLRLPEQLAVGADYGLAVLAGPPAQQAAAARFAMFHPFAWDTPQGTTHGKVVKKLTTTTRIRVTSPRPGGRPAISCSKRQDRRQGSA